MIMTLVTLGSIHQIMSQQRGNYYVLYFDDSFIHYFIVDNYSNHYIIAFMSYCQSYTLDC